MLRFFFLFLMLSILVKPVLSQGPWADTSDVPIITQLQLHPPDVLIEKIEATFELALDTAEFRDGFLKVQIDTLSQILEVDKGKATFSHILNDEGEIRISVGDREYTHRFTAIPLWLSILPPLLAIFLALMLKEVIISLFAGLFLGSGILGVYAQGIRGLGSGFLDISGKYIPEALSDPDHGAIIVFSMLIGGMVALISRNGGMQGVVTYISRYAKNARSAQFATWLLGIAIFFDDYANSLVVGSTMRPITDRLRISREKLAYIVDSTAAPVAALAFVTTWIGAELSYIEQSLPSLEGFPEDMSAYAIFFNSLPYAFYPILPWYLSS